MESPNVSLSLSWDHPIGTLEHFPIMEYYLELFNYNQSLLNRGLILHIPQFQIINSTSITIEPLHGSNLYTFFVSIITHYICLYYK